MDFMTLKAKLTLDDKDYNKGMDDAEGRATGIGSKVAGGAKLIAKGFAVAGAAAVTAVGVMTKAAVSGYAEMEQLKGGVETLFGDYASAVIKNSNEAWKTAGMDANQYMETTIQSAAAMINSLGGDRKKAAELSNMAIIDMADNVNKMGTTMESVQDAYRGFSRGNFAMLDNLALGYQGSRTEMERLLKDAEKISGIKYDISSYADIVQAIHVVQDEMGITGTTAKEASTTIQGSVNAMKSAWQNLMAGLADPTADLDQLIGNVIDSAVTVADNVGPVIIRTLDNVGKALVTILPKIIEKIPKAIDKYIVPLMKTGIQVVLAIIKGLAKAAPKLIPAIVKAILEMVDAMIDNIDLMVDAAIELGLGIAEGLIKATPLIVKKLPEIIVKIVAALIKNLPKFVSAGGELIKSLANGMYTAFTSIPSNIASRASKIGDSIRQGASNLYNIGKERILDLWYGIRDIFVQIPDLVRNYASSIPSKIKQGIGSLYNTGWNLIAGFWNGIRDKFDDTIDRVKSLARKLPKAVKKVLGIASPSKVFADIGQWIPEGLAKGIEDNLEPVRAATNAMVDGAAFGADGFEFEIDEGRGYSAGMNNTFNIYAQPGQDVQELAREVEKVLVRLQNQRKAAFA